MERIPMTRQARQETREEFGRRSEIGNQSHGRLDPVAARTGVRSSTRRTRAT
jgi:hypothetical protein